MALEDSFFQRYLPAIIGAAVAGVLSLLLVRRRSRGLPEPPPPKPASHFSDSVEETYANRRASSRREGPPVRVVISSPIFRGTMEKGWVLDRSTGGLRIAITRPLPINSLLQVRAENAPDTIPWTSLIVRSCRDEGKHHEIGCAFESTPPWNVLLHFG